MKVVRFVNACNNLVTADIMASRISWLRGYHGFADIMVSRTEYVSASPPMILGHTYSRVVDNLPFGSTLYEAYEHHNQHQHQ
jgi:hypothetical protein